MICVRETNKEMTALLVRETNIIEHETNGDFCS
jgi:hypothetical protein